MAAPANEMLRELERELEIAKDEGVTLSVEELMERVALEGDDMDAALDILRTHGKAVEESPRQWRAPYGDEVPEAVESARVRVSATTDESHDGVAASMEQWEAEQLPLPPLIPPLQYIPPQATVRLTRSIADALNAESLGQLVKAGIGDTDGPFLLEVVP
jgi:hypothetical protein